MEVYRRPLALLIDTQEPELADWWQYIAYGAAKKVLEDKLQKHIDYLCYPMGGYDERVEKAARRAGYKAAFGTKPTRLVPRPDMYAIKRVRISRTADNPFVFAIKLSGYHAFFRVIMNDYKETPVLQKKAK